MLNLRIMRHWENWIIVFLMVLIASVAFDLTGRIVANKKKGN